MTTPGSEPGSAPQPSPAPHVLVVEDDPSVRGLLDTLLSSEGYQVATASDGIAGLNEAAAHRPAVILLDLVMPDLGGMQVLQEMKANPVLSEVPVVVVTGRLDAISDLEDQLGPDRVFPKPFGVADLLARVRANLRRVQAVRGSAEPVFRFGEVEVDQAARVVRRRGAEVHLTPIEYRLLGVLIANAGRVLTHPQLLREVWGPGHATDTHYLRVHMGKLRQKLEDDSAQPRHIVTETGVGYRLVAD